MPKIFRLWGLPAFCTKPTIYSACPKTGIKQKKAGHLPPFLTLAPRAAWKTLPVIDSASIIIAHFTKKGRPSLKIVDMPNAFPLCYQSFYFFPTFLRVSAQKCPFLSLGIPLSLCRPAGRAMERPPRRSTGGAAEAFYFCSVTSSTSTWTIFSIDWTGIYSITPWKLAPPVDRLGQGKPI